MEKYVEMNQLLKELGYNQDEIVSNLGGKEDKIEEINATQINESIVEKNDEFLIQNLSGNIIYRV